MKKLISLILSAAMIAAMCIAGSVTAFASTYTGSGTEADPYVVTTDKEFNDVLQGIKCTYRINHIRLEADINTGGYTGFYEGENPCIDLNGHTLKANSIWTAYDCKLSLKNGTVEGFYENNYGYLVWAGDFYAKNVTFLGPDFPAGDQSGASVLYLDGSNFYINGCTIISGDLTDDTTLRRPTLWVDASDESVGVITDTRIERGSGALTDKSQTLRIDGGRITDGDGNPLSSSDMNEDVVIIPPSAFAPITTNGGSRNYRVKATYQAGAAADIVYSVNIAWGSMEFTYTDASEGTWNPENHTFENQTAAAWSCDADANKITVTNHSNTAIDAALSYASESDYSAISGLFTNAEGTAISNSLLRLATAKNTTVENAPKEDAFLKLEGALSESTTETKIGSVTVTISDRD